MRRFTLALFALAALALAPLSMAELPLLQEEAPAATGSVAADQAPDMGLYDLFAALSANQSRVTASATAETFCTRAVDIGGAFCFIGCPEGCHCDVQGWFSQCCCDVAAQ